MISQRLTLIRNAVKDDPREAESALVSYDETRQETLLKEPASVPDDSPEEPIASSSTFNDTSNNTTEPCFPGVNSDDSVKDPNYSSSTSSDSDSSSSDFESSSMPTTTASEELPSSLSANEVQGTNLLTDITNTGSSSDNRRNLTRKRQRNEHKWLRNNAKILRNSGKSHITRTKKIKPDKKMGPPCTEKCRQKRSLKISEEHTRDTGMSGYRDRNTRNLSGIAARRATAGSGGAFPTQPRQEQRERQQKGSTTTGTAAEQQQEQ
ncbi:vitellogenin-1-like [Aricia agestis]|uniref:vitellogenin-1-like n=1 Tax=Aricia agestis TaxID=91739 RepID=UPI001C20331C|nr:vitellogenin-1-like [Aricia agestis]